MPVTKGGRKKPYNAPKNTKKRPKASAKTTRK